jgi:hypothetical protein
MKTYKEYAKEYGTVTYNNREYALTESAYLDNYNCEAVYMANAIDEEGNDYLVIWKPTKQWELSREYSNIESHIALLHDYEKEQAERRMKAIEAEIEKVGGFVNIDDEYACDWDEPYCIIS